MEQYFPFVFAHLNFCISCALTVLAAILMLMCINVLYRKSFIKTFFNAIFPVTIVAGVGTAICSEFGYMHVLYTIPVAGLTIIYTLLYMNRLVVRSTIQMRIKLKELCTGDVDTLIDKKYENGTTEIHSAVRNLNRYITQLQTIRKFVQDIGEENYDTRITAASEHDSMAISLIKMRENLLAAQQERQQRIWMTDGIAQFADILRTHGDSIADLSHAVIKHLVKYTNANQGGLFIYVDDDESYPVPYLELTACYAFSRDKYIDKRVEIGDGLVSTCFQEGQPIYLTDVPKTYVEITSGLGGDVPRAVYIVPLKVNDNVCGVIELASFTQFDDHVRAFIDKIAENIASTILTYRTHHHTTQLLEKAELQAERMSSQEEHLRTTIEELELTQEAARYREVELYDTLNKMDALQEELSSQNKNLSILYESLSQSFCVLETSPDGTIIAVNDMTTQLYQMDKSAILGTNIKASLGEEQYNAVMEYAQAGRHTSFDWKQEDKGLIVHGNFIPFMNNKNTCEKTLFVFYIEKI